MNQLNLWLIRVFSIVWILFLFLDYASSSGYFTQAFSFFKYTGLIVTTLLISAGLSLLFVRKQKNTLMLQVSNYRNIYAYPLVLLFMMLIMGFYLGTTDLKPGAGGGILMFLFKTIGFHMAILPVVAASYGCGSVLFRATGLRINPVSAFLISLAAGFGVLSLVLFLAGAAGMLKPWVVFPLLAIMIWPGVKPLLSFVKEQLVVKSKPFELHALSLFPLFMVILIMALNFCYTTRPFPIGFDDLNLYMNTPKLIAGYEGLTQGGDAYNWSLVMSLGFVLYKSAAVAILLSVLPGILTLFVIYRIARNLDITREWALVACSLFYTMPNIIWQSRNDAKVDLALTFVTLCAVLLLMEYYKNRSSISETTAILKKQFSTLNSVWLLSGLLLGYAFGIKYTSMMVIFGFMTYLFYMTAGKWAAVGMFFMNFAVIFGLKLTRFAAFEAESVLLGITPLVIASGFLIFAFIKKRNELIRAVSLSIIFAVSIGITFVPWAIKNVSEHGSVSFTNILTGKSPAPLLYPEMKSSQGTLGERLPDPENPDPSARLAAILIPEIDISGFFSKPELLAQNESPAPEPGVKKETPKYTDKYEEIRRYLGYETGVVRFISLPYDLAMKANVKLWSADTGIIFLLLLPLLVFAYGNRQLPFNLVRMILLSVFLIASVVSVYTFSGPFRLDEALSKLQTEAFTDAGSFTMFAPLYIFMKKMVLIAGNVLYSVYHALTVQSLGFSFMLVMFSSFLFYFLFSHTWKDHGSAARAMLALTFTVLLTWMILASGIFWYGMAGFTLLMIALVWLTQNKPGDRPFHFRLTGTVIALWFLLILPFQFMPVRFTMAARNNQTDYTAFIDQPFAKYALGGFSEKEVFRNFLQPAEQGIINTINSNRKDRVLNVSTFLTYHIIDNDRRVIIDNQLGVFEKMHELAGGDRDKILDEMKRHGIRYVLVSLYTPTLDMTPEQTLRKKFTNLMNTLVNNPRTNLLYTNRVVERPDGQLTYVIDGRQVRGMYHLAGIRVLDQGSVAMFEIL